MDNESHLDVPKTWHGLGAPLPPVLSLGCHHIKEVALGNIILEEGGLVI